MYRKVARFNTVRYDKNKKLRVTANAGSGFFYTHENQVYFVTDRNYVIIEEKAFLPDSIIIHRNSIEWQTKHTPIEGMEIPLYDKNEKPVWQVLPVPEQYERRVLISIPMPQEIARQRQIDSLESSFLAIEQFPKEVYLTIDDDDVQEIKNDKDISLSIPVQTGLSLADYFLYSDKSNEKELQKNIEKQHRHSYHNYNYDDINQTIDVNFKIHRKNFAKDMVEMILVLLEQNMDKTKKLTDEQNLKDHNESDSEESERRRNESKEISELLQIHSNLMKELENIIEQFQDVLEPSIFDRIETIFKIMMTKQNRLAGLLLLTKNESDYLIVKHLIHKILDQMGRNIVFVQ